MVLLPEDFALPCQVQKVEEVPNWMEFLSVLTTESDAYCHDPEAHSDKMHVLLYLSSRHWNEAKDKKALVVSNYGSGSSGGNKNKTHQTRKYNRMAFFADLLSPGRVCCKITDTQHESLGFFENMIHGGYGIGWIYILEEYVCARAGPVGVALCPLVPPCQNVQLSHAFNGVPSSTSGCAGPELRRSISAAAIPSPCWTASRACTQ